MELLIKSFNLILYQPLFNALILLYQYLPGRDFGIAVIVLTILIKILFYPLESLGIKSQKALSQLQSKIKEIQEKYKGNRQKQTEEVIKLYQKEKINPFSGCLPLLLQLPILIALFQVFRLGFQSEQMVYLYSFVPQSGPIDQTFLGKLNLANPNLFLAVLTGVAQFFQAKMTQPKIKESKTNEKDFQFGELIQKQALYFFPVLTVLILTSLPSALGLYWLVWTIFSTIQQYFIFKKNDKSS